MREMYPAPVIPLPRVAFPNETDSALPLEQTSVQVHVTGPLAAVTVTQRFGNPQKETAELDYLFPLPEQAAITGFEILIGSRRISGSLQESKTAREEYESARDQGRRAGLFEQRRPNLFAVRLANIQPGETIHTTVRYQQRLAFEGDGYEFVFPMGLTPRYDRPDHPEESKGANAPLARGDEKIGPVEIQLSVDAGVPVGKPTSPSHPIQYTSRDARRFEVRLDGEHIPDHDFVLRYPAAGEQLQAAAWTAGSAGQEFFLAALLPPAQEHEQASTAAREFIFVLDRSGSMTGEPIAQARNALRACLRALDAQDTFRILLFDNDLEWFQSEPSAVTQAEVDRADTYLDQVQGRGGTEILRALEAVLGLPADPRRTRFIVFLTDGAVSAEASALERIRSRIGAARLFTFGIGPSVNRALLSRMAVIGRGRASFLQLDEDIEGAIIRFQDSVSFPALTDLSLAWENGKAWDVYPARLPDLYYGQPLEICGRLARSQAGATRLILRGKRAGQPVELALEIPQPQVDEKAVARVWARARVDDLLEEAAFEPGRAEKIRSEILGLALEYNLVTVYSSFVALDQEPGSAGGPPKIIHVAQPLPKGLSPQGFSGPVQAAGMVPPSPVSFMRHLAAPSADVAQPKMAGPTRGSSGMVRSSAGKKVEQAGGSAGEAESVLRELARTQKLNGSWDGDVELTSAALLAFIRAGHTTRAGSFRQVVRRAGRWLAEQKAGGGFAPFARALALRELASASGDAKDQAASDAAAQALPQPENEAQAAVAGRPSAPPAALHSLDDLRLAAVLNAARPEEVGQFKSPDAALARAWLAAITRPKPFG